MSDIYSEVYIETYSIVVIYGYTLITLSFQTEVFFSERHRCMNVFMLHKYE